MRLTRRELLGAAAAAAVGARAAVAGTGARGRVVVVGGGLAGLACARELEQAGFRVTVLEARDRLGGRVLTERDAFDGRPVELGAEQVSADDTAVRSLAGRLGLALDPVSPPGGVVYRVGRRRTYRRFVTPAVEADLERYRRRVGQLAAAIDPADPLRTGRAFDARSARWLLDRLELSDRGRFLVEHDLRDRFTVEPENISLLFLLQQARVGRREPAYRIRGGADGLLAIADGLADVRLESPVRLVERGRRSVTVVFEGGRVDADWCVLAVPLPLLAAIDFEPDLPPALTAASEKLHYGHAAKIGLRYERSFWPKNGQIRADVPFQTAWHGGRDVLTASPTGRNGLLYGTVGERGRTMLAADEIDDVYPGSRALLETGTSVVWHNEGWSRGSQAAFAPGQVSRFWRLLRRPAGRLWLAGEHADPHVGTMEGALRSGQRVARAIVSG